MTAIACFRIQHGLFQNSCRKLSVNVGTVAIVLHGTSGSNHADGIGCYIHVSQFIVVGQRIGTDGQGERHIIQQAYTGEIVPLPTGVLVIPLYVPISTGGCAKLRHLRRALQQHAKGVVFGRDGCSVVVRQSIVDMEHVDLVSKVILRGHVHLRYRFVQRIAGIIGIGHRAVSVE